MVSSFKGLWAQCCDVSSVFRLACKGQYESRTEHAEAILSLVHAGRHAKPNRVGPTSILREGNLRRPNSLFFSSSVVMSILCKSLQ